MEQITIAGKIFNAPIRYEEGHELTAGEASALNQTYHENLRNNFAKKVKEADEAGSFNEAAFQKEFDEYAESYQFGVRSSGGGTTRDPVMQAAMNIAKTQIRVAVKKKYGKVSIDAAIITEKAKQLVAKDPRILELARQRVQEEQNAAADDLGDLIGDLPTKQAAE